MSAAFGPPPPPDWEPRGHVARRAAAPRAAAQRRAIATNVPARITVRDRSRAADAGREGETSIDLETASRVMGGADMTPAQASKLLKQFGACSDAGFRELPKLREERRDSPFVYVVVHEPLDVYATFEARSTELARGEHTVELWDVPVVFEDGEEANRWRDSKNTELYIDTHWRSKLTAAEVAEVEAVMDTATRREKKRVAPLVAAWKRDGERGPRPRIDEKARRYAFLGAAGHMLQAKLDRSIAEVVLRGDGGYSVCCAAFMKK